MIESKVCRANDVSCLSSSFFIELIKDVANVNTSFNDDFGPPKFEKTVGIFTETVCFCVYLIIF
jgi:hypothetical protein